MCYHLLFSVWAELNNCVLNNDQDGTLYLSEYTVYGIKEMYGEYSLKERVCFPDWILTGDNARRAWIRSNEWWIDLMNIHLFIRTLLSHTRSLYIAHIDLVYTNGRILTVRPGFGRHHMIVVFHCWLLTLARNLPLL